MITWIKKQYAYVYGHNIFNKVAATILFSFLSFLAKTLYVFFTSLKYGNFWKQVLIALDFRLSIGSYLLLTIIFAYVFYLCKRTLKRKREKKNQVNQQIEVLINKDQLKALAKEQKPNFDIPPQQSATTLIPATKPSQIIFDSAQTTIDSYKFYGERIWDEPSKSLVGIKGEGILELNNNIITIIRKNIDGRYIFELRDYYPNKTSRFSTAKQFIRYLPLGNEYQYFRIIFQAKSRKGAHSFSLKIKKQGTHEWKINMNWSAYSYKWTDYTGSIMLHTDDDFYFEMQTQMTSAEIGILQFRNFVIEEIDKKDYDDTQFGVKRPGR